jgi:hypothetical protein
MHPGHPPILPAGADVTDARVTDDHDVAAVFVLKPD